MTGGYVALTDSLKLMMDHYKSIWSATKYDQWLQHTYDGIQFYKEQFKKIPAGYNRAYNVHRFLIEIEKDERAQNPEDWNKVSCRMGCSACCYKPVGITDDEADLLVEHCKEEKIDIDVDHLTKQADWTGTSNEFFNRGEDARCVFLKDNKCSVYKHRPAACRKFFVVSDPKECGGPSGNKILTQISHNMELVHAGAMDIDFSRVGNMAEQLLKRLEGVRNESGYETKRMSTLPIDGRP